MLGRYPRAATLCKSPNSMEPASAGPTVGNDLFMSGPHKTVLDFNLNSKWVGFGWGVQVSLEMSAHPQVKRQKPKTQPQPGLRGIQCFSIILNEE